MSRRRLLSFAVRPSIHLALAALFFFLLVASECALIPSRRYDTDNLIAGAVLIVLTLLFLVLAGRAQRKRRP